MYDKTNDAFIGMSRVIDVTSYVILPLCYDSHWSLVPFLLKPEL
jgi:hypothetical protein